MDFLTEAFCVDHPHFEKSERGFREWTKKAHANHGAFEKAMAWRPSYDIARDIACTVFGVELGRELGIHVAEKHLSTREALRRAKAKKSSYQRLSVYMQRHLPSVPGSKMTIFNSGTKGWRKWARANTILIYESASGDQINIVDPLSLRALELRHPVATDEWAAVPAAVTATENVLTLVFESIVKAWHRQITKLSIQHASLEDRLYETPSDDRHAGALWGMSQHALEMAKLVNRHATLCQDVQEYFNIFAERDEEEDWLDDLLKSFRQTSVTIREDFISPTEHMIDLVQELPLYE